MLTRNKLRIYGCGGCGINLAKPYLFGHHDEALLDETRYADIQTTLIDTSYSNLGEVADKEVWKKDIVIVNDGTEGSGSLRSENLQAIRSHIMEEIIKIRIVINRFKMSTPSKAFGKHLGKSSFSASNITSYCNMHNSILLFI